MVRRPNSRKKTKFLLFPTIGENSIGIPPTVKNSANGDYTILREVVNTEIADIHDTDT